MSTRTKETDGAEQKGVWESLMESPNGDPRGQHTGVELRPVKCQGQWLWR